MEPEHLSSLGLAGVFHEAHAVVLSRRRLFTQITAAFVLPLSAVFLAHAHISAHLLARIKTEPAGVLLSDVTSDIHAHCLLPLSDWAALGLLKVACLLAILALSILSTAAVAYAAACAHASTNVGFSKAMSVVPAVGKRLAVTSLWAFSTLLLHNSAAVLAVAAGGLLLGPGPAGAAMLVGVSAVYVLGLVCLGVTWNLARVVSVAEDAYGFSALRRARGLVRGKECMASGAFLVFHLLFVGAEVVFREAVVQGGDRWGWPWWVRAGVGAATVLGTAGVMLYGLVVAAVVYIVCREHHRERIGWVAAVQLEGYLGEYVPLKGTVDVQLEQLLLGA